jgi:hypothetical protein
MAVVQKKASNDSDKSWQTSGKYLEPALIITFLTVSTYFMGWLRAESYFGRLGISSSFIEFPTAYYVKESFPALAMGLASCVILFPLALITKNIRLRTFIENSALLVTAAIIMYSDLKGDTGIPNRMAILSFVVFSSLYVFTSVRKWSVIREFIAYGLLARLSLIVSFVVALAIFSSALGHYQAERLLDGSLKNITWIQIKTSKPVPEVDNEYPLLLILHNENKYYVTKRVDPIPKFPIVYIIPDDQVEFAILSKPEGIGK